MKLGYSTEIRVLHCKLGQFQKIREINAGHLYHAGTRPKLAKYDIAWQTEKSLDFAF